MFLHMSCFHGNSAVLMFFSPESEGHLDMFSPTTSQSPQNQKFKAWVSYHGENGDFQHLTGWKMVHLWLIYGEMWDNVGY